MQRALSSSEHGMLRTGLNIVTAAVLARRVAPEALGEAIRRVRPACPLLGARVRRGAGGRLQAACDGEPLPVRVLPAGATWQAAALEELARTYRAECEPLARFALLHEGDRSTLVTSTHHAVSDGLAGVWLVGELLAALADPDLRWPASAIPTPADDLCPAGLVSPAVALGLRAAGLASALVGPPRAVRAAPKESCGLLAWGLDERETSDLVAGCRAAGATVHAALCAAFRLAEARVQGRRPRLAHVYTPVNVRSLLTRPVGDAFGFYASEMLLPLHVRPTDDFRAVLRRADAALRRGAADRSALRLLATTARAHPFLVERVTAGIRARKGIRFGTGISNLGRVAFREEGAPLLVALHGPLAYLERAEKAVTATTVAGRASFTMTWRRRTIGEGVVVAVRDRAMDLLRTCAASAP